MTSLCFAETLGVLKVKHFHRKELSKDQYFYASYLLIACLRENRIMLDELPVSDLTIFLESENLSKKYKIDLVDAMQLVTVKRGRFSAFCEESRTIFITADSCLAKAAREEGLRVWNCVKEDSPTMM